MKVMNRKRYTITFNIHSEKIIYHIQFFFYFILFFENCVKSYLPTIFAKFFFFF